MKTWTLSYGGKDYEISDDEKKVLTRRKPNKEMPSGWLEVKLLDGRSLCMLLSVGATIALEQKEVPRSVYEDSDVMTV